MSSMQCDASSFRPSFQVAGRDLSVGIDIVPYFNRPLSFILSPSVSCSVRLSCLIAERATAGPRDIPRSRLWPILRRSSYSSWNSPFAFARSHISPRQAAGRVDTAQRPLMNVSSTPLERPRYFLRRGIIIVAPGVDLLPRSIPPRRRVPEGPFVHEPMTTWSIGISPLVRIAGLCPLMGLR